MLNGFFKGYHFRSANELMNVKRFSQGYHFRSACELLNVKRLSKFLDFVRWQGASRFKNGAYTAVLEYFEAACNTASGQKMRFLKAVLDEALVKHGIHDLNKTSNVSPVDVISGGAVLLACLQ